MHQCYLGSSAVYFEKKSLLRGWLSPDVMTFPFNELCSLVALNTQQARQKLSSSLHEWLWRSKYDKCWEGKPRKCSWGRALRDEEPALWSNRKGVRVRRLGPGAGGGRRSRRRYPAAWWGSSGSGKRTPSGFCPWARMASREAGKKWVHRVNSLCELTVESRGIGDRLISGMLMKRLQWRDLPKNRMQR